MNEPQPKANMIETCSAYKVGDETFVSLREAQVHAIIAAVFPSSELAVAAKAAIEEIVAQQSKVIAILTMNEPTPKTRKPRSDQGKPHRKKKTTTPEPEACPVVGVTVEGSGNYAGK